MASSSCSSCLARQGNYDVFVSFRGEDTRDNFTSHLFAALDRKKITTFIDEELMRGDEISPALLNVIEGSKISVIIFSKNYASSQWCLDELVKILECQKMNGQMVIPVFYHVRPSDVRKQNGSFGDAFDKHEQHFKKIPEKVQKWRVGLIEAANLSGWDSMKIRPEAKLVDEIIKDIVMKLERISPSSDSEDLVGLNSRIERIKSLLCLGLPDVLMVGIWGMGGIGKTTIARSLFSQISCEFDGTCFVENVREQSEKGSGLVHLREQVLSQILDENFKIRSPYIPQHTKERLRRMKTFIVLDDVNKFKQLEYLVGELDQVGPGSRIVVTTRDRQVLDKYGVNNIYEVEGFNYDEAQELFCNHAFKKDKCPPDLISPSTMVINYAKGNPLALKVLGCTFYRKSKKDWENALHNLKQISEPDMHDVLKSSYDELSWEERNIFLDIACFFNGEDKEYVTTILEDYYSVHYGLSVLINKSLIKIYLNKLQMHDLLQEMGQKIVQEESMKEPGKRSRLWHHEDIYNVLKKNKGTDSIEGIFLDMSKIRDIHLCSNAFVNMPNLRLLKFHMSGHFDILNMRSKVHLPQGLEYLSDEIRYLHWHGYPLNTLPLSFNPENLIIISLPYGKVNRLWKGEKEAFKLKQIDLRGCQYLTRIPHPLESPNVECIYLSNCTNLPCIPSSIHNFHNLSLLSLQGCKSLERFSENIHFRSPIILDFSDCVNLTKFPCISGNIKVLDLCGTAIDEVPSSIECLTELVDLYMMHCTRLRSLSTNISKLGSLRLLALDDCWALGSFPEIFEKMKCLEYISLASSTQDKVPLSSIEQGMLPFSKADLYKPEEFWRFRCRGLVLPTLPGLSSLTWLNLSYRNIVEIPQDIGCLSSLRSLLLRGNNIESLPTSIKQLSQLEDLVLSDCNMLQSLPQLPLRLDYLEAINCKQLQALSELPPCPEELDVSKLEVLSECCLENDKSFIRFLFTNCLKLEQAACNKVLEDSKLRIQHMAIASMRLFYDNEFDTPPQISIFLPGRGIPDWFIHQSSGSSLRIMLPQCGYNRRIMGFALCVVIAAVEESYYTVNNFGIQCRCYLETNIPTETKYSYWIHFLGAEFRRQRVEEHRIDSSHVLLGFYPCFNVKLPNADHHTVASFEFSPYPSNKKGYKLTCCGVCPLYAIASETESNIFHSQVKK